MAKVTLNEERCKGCLLCVHACAKSLIAEAGDRLNEKGYHPVKIVDMGKCTGCAFCAAICPDCVIMVEK
jgi:2-oxoglutarate ferredoxin oxidoreductase subunit delta